MVGPNGDNEQSGQYPLAGTICFPLPPQHSQVAPKTRPVDSHAAQLIVATMSTIPEPLHFEQTADLHSLATHGSVSEWNAE